jgi:hypothetical protein
MIASTPPLVAQWLREKREIYPLGHFAQPIVERLADDERMASMWDSNEAGSWPSHIQLMIVMAACLYRTDPMLEDLCKLPENRTFMTRHLHALAMGARQFSRAIEISPAIAARLWAGVDDSEVDLMEIDALMQRLRIFADQAVGEANSFLADFDNLPPPNRTGRGNARQLAFRQVLQRTLARLLGAGRELLQCDRIVALLESVVFATEVDPDTVTRTRQRQTRRRQNETRQFG